MVYRLLPICADFCLGIASTRSWSMRLVFYTRLRPGPGRRYLIGHRPAAPVCITVFLENLPFLLWLAALQRLTPHMSAKMWF